MKDTLECNLLFFFNANSFEEIKKNKTEKFVIQDNVRQ